MAEMKLIAPGPLEELTARIFAGAGAPQDIAATTAQHLVKANLSGHDSHGVIRISAYLRQIDAGGLNPSARPAVVEEWPATAVVDAKRTFGQYAAAFAMDVAIGKAEKNGIGAVSIRHCNHIGRLGHYSEQAAEKGFIALVTYGSSGPNSGHAAPFGGAARHLGTNPLSAGVPGRQSRPMVVDFATTVVAEGKIQVARAKHAELPPGSIVNKEGKPSTTPQDFYDGGMILLSGGHKGYGLSLLTAFLGAGLTAEQAATEGRGGGVFMIAVNPRAFAGEAAYTGTIDNLAAAVKAVPPAPGVKEVLLPGEPEANSRAERQQNGIPIPEDTWTAVSEAAARFNVPLPEIAGTA